MKNFTVTLLLLLFAMTAFSQKKPLDHSVYDTWKSVPAEVLSNENDHDRA